MVFFYYHTMRNRIFMDINNIRNIVILKDLPSNIIDEAFVILKKSQKIPKLEYASNNQKFNKNNEIPNENEYVIKEAELLISNYVDTLGNSKSFSADSNKLLKKCKRLKIFATILSVLFIISLFV